MFEQIGWIRVGSEGVAFNQFVGREAAGQKADADRTGAASRQHVPGAISHDDRDAGINPDRLRTSEEEMRVGFGERHVVPGHDGTLLVHAQHLQHGPRLILRPAGRDPPSEVQVIESIEQLTSPRQRPDRFRHLGVEALMTIAQLLDLVVGQLPAGFAQDTGGQQVRPHTDASVNAPQRHRYFHLSQGSLPREHVLIDGVHQSPIKVEDEGGIGRLRVHTLEYPVGNKTLAELPRSATDTLVAVDLSHVP